MMLKLKINIILLLFICFSIANAQTNAFKFKRNVTGVSSYWHKMQLPNQLYKNANSGFDDLRIFGIDGKDTVEVPYLFKTAC